MSVSTTRKIIWHMIPPTFTRNSIILPNAWITILEVVLKVSWLASKCIMPSSLTTLAGMINIDAPMSTNPSIIVWLVSIVECNVLLWWVLLTLTLQITWVEWIAATWFLWPSTSFLLLTSLTNPSKYSNSLRIIRMVSMGIKEIFPLMKWEKNLDFTTASDPKFFPLCSSSVITSSFFLLDWQILVTSFLGFSS